MFPQPALQHDQPAIRPIVKLPNIDLPFDGNCKNWVPFRDLFESVTGRFSVDSVDRGERRPRDLGRECVT